MDNGSDAVKSQGNTRSRERDLEDPIPEPSDGVVPANPWISDSQPPEQCDNKFLLFQPLGVWHFVMAALPADRAGLPGLVIDSLRNRSHLSRK